MADLLERLSRIQGNFKAAGLRVRPWVRSGGTTIALRGQLPPKPRPGEEGHPQRPLKQQTIPLGLRLSAANLSAAEIFARTASLQVAQRKFDWAYWIGRLEPETDPAGPTFADAIAKFREEWFAERMERLAQEKPHWSMDKRQETTAKTWDGYYKAFCSLLPPAKPFDPADLDKAIAGISPAKPLRNRACGIAQRLAASQGITYSAQHLRVKERDPAMREPPTDDAIVATWEAVRGEDNKFLVGMLAAYGLRPHELYHVDPESLREGPEVRLLEGKTGARIVYPFPPVWYEKFRLFDPVIPSCSDIESRSNVYLGKLIHNRLRRAGVHDAGLSQLYDLRHAWAIRCILLGVPDKIAADQMGHSLAIHAKTYQRWISREIHRRVFDEVVARTTG